MEVDAMACEAFAAMVREYVSAWLTLCLLSLTGRVHLSRVEVRPYGAACVSTES